MKFYTENILGMKTVVLNGISYNIGIIDANILLEHEMADYEDDSEFLNCFNKKDEVFIYYTDNMMDAYIVRDPASFDLNSFRFGHLCGEKEGFVYMIGGEIVILNHWIEDSNLIKL